ncbi:hypothetical protein R1sor_004415 [Riccia sorocarpa]|uniref:Uncharacterized protein n=1 Tax=Riccia sorocarpa TaxID=122646 RepID=A0ABD3HK44_9MARC
MEGGDPGADVELEDFMAEITTRTEPVTWFFIWHFSKRRSITQTNALGEKYYVDSYYYAGDKSRRVVNCLRNKSVKQPAPPQTNEPAPPKTNKPAPPETKPDSPWTKQLNSPKAKLPDSFEASSSAPLIMEFVALALLDFGTIVTLDFAQ